MPKVPKRIGAAALAGQAERHEPLGQIIQDDANRHKYAAANSNHRRNKKKKKQKRTRIGDDEEEPLLDERASQRILELGRVQQLEVQAEEEMARRQKSRQQQQERGGGGMDSDDDDDAADLNAAEEEDLDLDDDNFVEHDEGYVTIVDGAAGLSPEDEALVASMMKNPAEERRTLADIILEKIEEKEAEKRGEKMAQQGEGMIDLPPKVVEVYTEIGKILSRYTSGKLPKAFKVIPSLSNWEEVLYLTRPDLWTPQAMFAATRIFASNLNPKMAQRFYNLVLLDSVRADISHNKKLNYHYYMALKKSVYKPAAFFKGILLPLAKDNCTLREAAIVASVLQRVSIPSHHSAVAIHKLAQQTDYYSGASSIFIKTLLNKKYSLPAPVIGSLVQHFGSFAQDDTTTAAARTSQQLPVLWHQALLVFVQRYKNEVKDQAREVLKKVMKKHFHPKITPEIRRELFGAQAWRDERSKAAGAAADDDDDDMDM